MLSYNDIIGYKFEKAGFGGGYRPEDVDKFTMRVASDYQKLEQEKADLEQKLVTLAEKLEEYRADEESLRAALLGAQKLGDSIVRESKQKAEMLLDSARAESDKIVGDARRQIEHEQGALTRMQKEVQNFKNRLLALYKQHLALISSIPGQEESPQEPQEMVPETQQPEPDTREYRPEPPAPEPPEQQAQPPAPPPQRESRFGELKFGEGYNIGGRKDR